MKEIRFKGQIINDKYEKGNWIEGFYFSETRRNIHGEPYVKHYIRNVFNINCLGQDLFEIDKNTLTCFVRVFNPSNEPELLNDLNLKELIKSHLESLKHFSNFLDDDYLKDNITYESNELIELINSI